MEWTGNAPGLQIGVAGMDASGALASGMATNAGPATGVRVG